MAGGSLLALIDDIASILDDVAAMTKVATQKTAGVLGDDLALNAQQVAGVAADRELPVVWAVAKGSAVNKAILVPAALGINFVAPWLVLPLLMCGGLFLCFEGFEKVFHKFLHPHDAEEEAHDAALHAAVADPEVDLVALEKEKIKGAIRTDFVLSAEIVTISLGVVLDKPFMTQLIVLAGISVLMTVGVYGFVAGIVKLDDLGFYLARPAHSAGKRKLGAGIIKAAPLLMKALAVVGTVAMFLVGGGIVVHGIGPLHHWVEGLAAGGGVVGAVVSPAVNLGVGVAAGGAVVALITVAKKFWPKKRAAA